MGVHEAVGSRDSAPAESKIRAEIDRVCASREFHRSEQCKRFLTYVCELALQGREEQINEYSIGIEIFHRPANYSPAEDGVVRRQAHVLRKKLDAYYAHEGQSDALRVEMPVGRYVPVFRPRLPEDVSPPDPAPAPPAGAYRKWLVPVAGAVGLAAAAFMAGRLVPMRGATARANGTAVAPSSQMEEIWGPWLHDPGGVTICLANSKAAIVHHVQDPKALDTHPEHFRPDAVSERSLREFYRFPPGGYLFYRPSEGKTGIAESIAAISLAQMFGRYAVPVQAVEIRLLNWSELRNGNFILLGHNEANPWVDKLLYKCPFRLGDSQGIRRYIENTNPAPGEKSSYFKEAAATSADPVVEYGLVSMLPGLDNGRKVLLVTGLDGQASQMASEFLTQPARLEQVLGRLKAIAPAHSGAWYFQLVLRAEVRDRLATRADIVTARVLGSRN